MKYSEQSRRQVTIQISILMLVFLVASSVANAIHGRYLFVYLYIISFLATFVNLTRYSRNGRDDTMANNVMTILFLLFFSFFYIGEQQTFDILWVLILPVVTFIISDYQKTQRWLGAFLGLLAVSIVMQFFKPEWIRYESFALWSMLWAGIFFSGMVLYYKKVQQQMQEEIDRYQHGLEAKVVKSEGEIQTLRTKNQEMDYKLIQSRLGSLETQLNPHFLFNALNSIAELIHQDSHKAEEAVLKVSSFLRNTMSEKNIISLREELQNVKAYVELENIRFAEAVKLFVPDDIPQWCVPKFSIQLLVENAIKHGYNPEKGELLITIYFNKEDRIIVVENDGKPMTSLEFGIGLNNLNERLAMLCKGHLQVVGDGRPKFCIHMGACVETVDC